MTYLISCFIPLVLCPTISVVSFHWYYVLPYQLCHSTGIMSYPISCVIPLVLYVLPYQVCNSSGIVSCPIRCVIPLVVCPDLSVVSFHWYCVMPYQLYHSTVLCHALSGVPFHWYCVLRYQLCHSTGIVSYPISCVIPLVKVKSSMARSLPVENLLPQNVRSIINYLQ